MEKKESILKAGQTGNRFHVHRVDRNTKTSATRAKTEGQHSLRVFNRVCFLLSVTSFSSMWICQISCNHLALIAIRKWNLSHFHSDMWWAQAPKDHWSGLILSTSPRRFDPYDEPDHQLRENNIRGSDVDWHITGEWSATLAQSVKTH